MLRKKNQTVTQGVQEPLMKRVRFKDSTIAEDQQGKKMSLFFSKQSKRSTDDYIKKVITSIGRTYEPGSFPDLATYGITEKRLEEFFLKNGYNLLHSAVLFYKRITILAFIKANVSVDIIKKVLKEKENAILKEFFAQPDGLKKFDCYTDDTRDVRVEKFILLLQIVPDLIGALVNSGNVSKYTKEEYQLAQEELYKTYLSDMAKYSTS